MDWNFVLLKRQMTVWRIPLFHGNAIGDKSRTLENVVSSITFWNRYRYVEYGIRNGIIDGGGCGARSRKTICIRRTSFFFFYFEDRFQIRFMQRQISWTIYCSFVEGLAHSAYDTEPMAGGGGAGKIPFVYIYWLSEPAEMSRSLNYFCVTVVKWNATINKGLWLLLDKNVIWF